MSFSTEVRFKQGQMVRVIKSWDLEKNCRRSGPVKEVFSVEGNKDRNGNYHEPSYTLEGVPSIYWQHELEAMDDQK